jgi:hypothetical protein
MTDAQAARASDDERHAWIAASLRKAHPALHGRWYADTSRETLRDESLRYGLLPVGAVVERSGLGKTSGSPRWALAADFAPLFTVADDVFPQLAPEWRSKHLTPAALSRIALVQHGVVSGRSPEGVLVTFPNGHTRRLSPGVSSILAKAIVEDFAQRYLRAPGVIWLSETSRKDEAADKELAHLVRLPIDSDEILPDVILVDLASEGDPQFVLVELVATGGPMTDGRRNEILSLLSRGGHDPASAAFVTAFLDRSAVYRKEASRIAWNSFVWFVSEPDKLIVQRDMERSTRHLFELLEP